MHAPRADVVSLLTPSIADWLRRELGPVAPGDRRRPEPAPPGPRPAQPARQPHHRRGRAAGDGEAVHQARRGLRRGRRPAARVAAADPRPGPPAPAPGPRDPQARAVGPRRAARLDHRHAQRVGAGQHLRADLAGRGVPARAAGGDGRGGAVRELRLRLRAARDRAARGQRPARRARVDRRDGLRTAAPRLGRRTCAPASAPVPTPRASSTTPTRSPRTGSASSSAPSPGGPAAPGSPRSAPPRRPRPPPPRRTTPRGSPPPMRAARPSSSRSPPRAGSATPGSWCRRTRAR